MKKFGMKAKLLIGQVPAMILVIAIVGIVIYLNTSTAILGQQEQVLNDLADNGSFLIDEFFTNYETKVEILAQDESIKQAILQKDGDLGMETMMNVYESNKNYIDEYLLENLIIVDSDGVIIDDVFHGAIGIDISQIPVYSDNVIQGKAGNTHFSDVGLSPVSGRPVVLFTAPVLSDSGKFIGLVGMPHETAYMFNNYIEESRIGTTGYSYMCTSEGIMLAHPTPDMIGVNLKDDYDFGPGLFATQDDYYKYNWKGNDKTVYVTINEKSGWFIMAGVNDSEFIDKMKGTIWTIIIGILSIAVISVLIIYFMTSIIYKGIKSNMGGFIETSGLLDEAATKFHTNSQQLSTGSQEQAASVEEISASISETATMTENNTKSTYKANELSKSTQKSANEANVEMETMQQTMEDIKHSSNEISKILKVIDDIAFQTNMLALNAAVEAARAGEAGSGFAVVANEVKNLATRSQEAAKNSALIIENSIATANSGAKASSKVASSLSTITEEISKIGVLMGEISSSSEQQSQGIEQINSAISQVETVTQQNADNAEEVAGAADNLNQQVDNINNLVKDLSQILEGDKDKKETNSEVPELDEGTVLMLD
ncbi:MAG: methyl-accepting chemotaxis protein [Clostridiales bacterium]|nr:methyl-accepting chemotaxis protein [Clostridiales bacterium]